MSGQMAYSISINRKIRNTRIYVVLRRVNNESNWLSRFIQSLIMRAFSEKNSSATHEEGAKLRK
jgi:hypothetical protein